MRVVGKLLAVLLLDGESVPVPVNAADIGVFPRFDAYRRAASGITHNVAGFVLRSPLPIGSPHLLAR